MGGTRRCLLAAMLLAGAVPATADEIYGVVDGVFGLNHGETMYITESQLVMAVVTGRGGCLAISVGGEKDCLELGRRYDLKWPHSPFHLGDTFAGKPACNLDVVQIDDAERSQARVVFRLMCD